MKRNISPDITKLIIELYVSGKSIAYINKNINLGYKIIKRILKTNNITIRQWKRGHGILTNNDIIDRYNRGESVYDISKVDGRSRVYITKILKQSRVEIRKPNPYPGDLIAARLRKQKRLNNGLCVNCNKMFTGLIDKRAGTVLKR